MVGIYEKKSRNHFRDVMYPIEAIFKYTKCSVSRWRPHKVDKRMVLEYTHGLFIT